MHIAIDGYEANSDKLVGVGTWASEIIKHLYKIDSQNEYTIFLPALPANLPKQRENWHYKVIPSKGFWTFTSLPFGIWTTPDIDVFFSPTHYIPRFVNTRRIVSIMDLSYLHYPRLFRQKDRYQLKNWTKYSIKNAAKIITISHFTKSEIIKYYSIPEEKIVVAYPGLNETYHNPKSQNPSVDIKSKYHILGDYILFVGTIQPRKNISRLLDAYVLAVNKCGNETIKLILVGKKGWLYEEIFQKAKKLNMSNKIIFLDFVPDSDMPYLYKNAAAFILPSLYEGFGIPVIEALSSGVPTVISDTTSLPEVGSDASIYIDPENIDSIKDGIIKAITLTPVKKAEMVKRGYRQASKFSWTNSAKIVLNTFKGIIK